MESFDKYIATFPQEVQLLLEQIRQTVREAAQEAQEVISYAMPTFRLNGNLVHFAANKHHIGFYPTPSGITAFRDEIAHYKSSKGAVKFPISKPLPLDLIAHIVRFRVTENLQ